MAKKRRGAFKQLLQQTKAAVMPLRLECTATRAVVEGCVRILAYDENRIVLETVEGNLGFEGERLRICRMAGGAALVIGKFSTVRFGEDAVCG